MKENIFSEALTSLLIVSDLYEFLDSGSSFIISTLTDMGCPEKVARFVLYIKGTDEEEKASHILQVIKTQGDEDAFERWSNQEDVIRDHKNAIIASMKSRMDAYSASQYVN